MVGGIQISFGAENSGFREKIQAKNWKAAEKKPALLH